MDRIVADIEWFGCDTFLCRTHRTKRGKLRSDPRCARQKREKAARGVRFKSGLAPTLIQVFSVQNLTLNFWNGQEIMLMLIWSVELKKWSPCHYRDSHYKDNMTSRPFYLILPPHNEVVEGYICFTPSVSPTSRVCSVAPTVLGGSISYLYLLSSRFAVSKLFRKISKFEFLANLKKITLTLSSLTWDLMWITSMDNHGVGWWGLEVSQNAGVLVVLIIIGIPWLEIGALLNLPL